MQKLIADERIPIQIWAKTVEEEALQQARNLANLPFAFRHVALMPDVHVGYGMPIGAVLATEKNIIPNAVGVDIGCGMCAIKSSLTEIDSKLLKKLMSRIRNRIPLGFKHHKHKQDIILMPDSSLGISGGIVEKEFENARTQIGTLGGGNHFIEIQKGSDEHLWIMVHSGSRNIGHTVAKYYNNLARKLNEQWLGKKDRVSDLSYLPVDSKEGIAYLAEMHYCIDFAFANRKLMMQNIKSVFDDEFRGKFEELQFINIAHNYAAREKHYNRDVWIHRKGATSAREGEMGIIPGSQGTKSYIVKGQGNPESFMSCSHGAGRIMGRKQAQRSLDLKYEIDQLDKKGIIHSIRSQRDLDEAPGAYKNIDEVMKNQQDLVKILVELEPLAVIKG